MRYECVNPQFTYDAEGGVDAAESVRAFEVSKFRTRRWDAGPLLHIEAYSVFKTLASQKLADKVARTNKAMQKVNDRNARLRLERLVALNFKENVDLVLGPDYFDEPTPEEARKNIAALMRRYKAEAKRRGVEEIKYIYVTPWLTETGKPTKRLHHHVIITSCGMSMNELIALWPHGRIHAEPLQPDKHGLIGLSEYLKNHLHGSKRWVSSKNLIKPKPEYPSKQLRKTFVSQLAVNYEVARDYFEQENPDYVFIGMDVRTSDRVSGAYILVRMRRRDAWMGIGRAA